MNHEADPVTPAEPTADESSYDAPKIENVITPADLEREVHYAGVQDGISLA